MNDQTKHHDAPAGQTPAELGIQAARADARDEARRFVGAVHDEVGADIGRNHLGERVVRIDLTYTRGTAASTTTMVLTTDAAIVLRNHLDGLFAAAGVDEGNDEDEQPEWTALLRAAQALLEARANQMVTAVEWRNLRAAVAACDPSAGDPSDGQVALEDACPNCGERRQDMLVWFDNADQVECEACGMVYAPPRAAGTAGQPRDEPRGW